MAPETKATIWFAVAAVAAVALAVVYAQGGQPQAEGVLLAVTFGGIGAAIVVWAKAATPHDEVTEERHPLASTDEEIAAFTKDFEAGEERLVDRRRRAPGEPTDGRPGGPGRRPDDAARRRLLTSAAAALAALGAALLFPVRSLGPRPGRDLKRTPYADRPRTRIVTDDGRPVRAADVPVDSVLTVWPEGHTDAADAPTLLIRTRSGRPFTVRAERQGWTRDGIVAYSKLCTHVGCPVGLYQAEEGLLLCPCHQSTFDVYDEARPIFGPAARPLPQLPLDVDEDGNLVATGDFSDPVGPGFWDRDR
jgi:ubiquinol-cytochrome c reductase iron-sulfur subunit